ncbi:MAG: DNA repair protein RadA, partial [Anaerolineales bacterium]|nr:DNA repair protein RadA [Anaerolineales bacterium]
MAKKFTQYICNSCGRITPTYMGRCPKCGEFGTMTEQVVEPETAVSGQKSRSASPHNSRPLRLAEITPDGFDRLRLPLSEFSRVLGGGI